MRTILPEFMGSMDHIKNNFYFSFLTINFLNQRPFSQDVILPINMSNNSISSTSINTIGNGEIQEYGNSIRRHFLNDMVIAYERYSMIMFSSHSNHKTRTDPALINNRQLGAPNFEQLPNVYSGQNVTFLVQLRRLRNSIVHYNGVYCKSSPLDYTFGNETYYSDGNEGKNISIEFDTLLWTYSELLNVVQAGNASYCNNYSIP